MVACNPSPDALFLTITYALGLALPCYSNFELWKDLGVENFNHTTFSGLKGLFNIISHDWSCSAGQHVE